MMLCIKDPRFYQHWSLCPLNILSLDTLCTFISFTIVLYLQYQVKFDQFVEQGRVLHNYASILELLLRLRQCCDHPFLVMRFGLLFMRLSIFWVCYSVVSSCLNGLILQKNCCVTFQQALIYSVLMSSSFGLAFKFFLNVCDSHYSLCP